MTEILLLVIASALVVIAATMLKIAFGRNYHNGWFWTKRKEEKKEEEPDLMDEGFENIMRFSVMGKTGFENGDNRWQ